MEDFKGGRIPNMKMIMENYRKMITECSSSEKLSITLGKEEACKGALRIKTSRWYL